MADLPQYQLPNPGLPFGQQAVSGVAQTNPLNSLASGIDTGARLGFQQRINNMQAEKQKQEMEIQKKQQEEKDFQMFGTAVKNLHALPSSIKQDYWNGVVAPYGKKIGLNISEGYNPEADDAITDDIKTIFDLHKKDPKAFTKDDVMGAIQLRALKAQNEGQEEKAKTLLDIAKEQKGTKTSSFMRPVSKVTDKGMPLYFSAELGGYATVDEATGEPTPYNGKQFPASANPSTGAETELRNVTQQKGILDEALNVLTPDKVGLLDKKWKTVGTYMDKSTDPEAVYFRSLSELANTMIRYKYYGATLTNNEQNAFSQIATNRNLSPTAYRAQARAMHYAMEKVENSIRSASAAANRPFVDAAGGQPAGNEDLSTMSDEELRKIAGGN